MVTAIVNFPNFYRLGKSSFDTGHFLGTVLTTVGTWKWTGGWTALGGTHFSFYREIPMFSNYEIRTNVACWDEKWVSVLNDYSYLLTLVPVLTPPISKDLHHPSLRQSSEKEKGPSRDQG